MAKFKGQLEDAQLHNKSSDPSNLPDGLVWLNTTSDKPKVAIDGAVKEILTNDSTNTVTNKTIVAANNTITTASSGNLAATELNAALAELQSDIDTRALGTGLSDHLSDATDAHDASAISFVAGGTIAATDVQTAIAEVATDAASALSNHEADTTGIHGITDTSALLTETNTKTVTNKAFSDSTTSFVDDGDNTKAMKFQVSGVTAGQTRVLTVPNFDGTLATLAGIETFTNKTPGQSWTPSANNTYDLGTSSTKWKDIYASGVVEFSLISSPSAPSSGVKIYAKSDGRVYKISSVDSTETEIGSGGYVVSATENISASGSISSSTADRMQMRPIAGNGGSVSASTTPFGNSGGWKDGTMILLVGTSDTNTVTLTYNDAAKGLVGNFDTIEISKYITVTAVYNSTLDRWLLAGRN